MCSWRGKQNDWELLAKIVLFLALIDILEWRTWWIMIFARESLHARCTNREVQLVDTSVQNKAVLGILIHYISIRNQSTWPKFCIINQIKKPDWISAKAVCPWFKITLLYPVHHYDSTSILYFQFYTYILHLCIIH